MWIHLVIAAYHGIRKLTDKTSTPTLARRRRKADSVVMLCPACHQIAVAREFLIEERLGKNPFRIANRIYQCSRCQHEDDTDLFENPGDGILQLRQ